MPTCSASFLESEPEQNPGRSTSPFPATLVVARVASAQALVAFRGNRYSVAPELAGADVTVTCRLGADHLDIATKTGTVIARHALAPEGSGAMVRDHGHVAALEQAAMSAATTARPHRSKQRIPPGEAARAAAETLRAHRSGATCGSDSGEVVDLTRYAAAACPRPARPPSNNPPERKPSDSNDKPAPSGGSGRAVHARAGQPLPTAAHPPGRAEAARRSRSAARRARVRHRRRTHAHRRPRTVAGHRG
ncbi:Mu transposase domain-containing protein [Haloechinothrix alba]|uniref:Mu transposase domain-containing protein n=1 Tax=Haloechinothrix alba TaxID=664784 RepID=UPI003CCBF2EF